MPLSNVLNWAPFRIDALGLVTILGAAEVDISVGRFVHNCITEWLPLLGAYTVANNQLASPIPGFVLYNITDGIMATDLSCWFTRWLMSYRITYSATVLKVLPAPRKVPLGRKVNAICIGFLAALATIVLASIMEDWWGLANALSMVVSVIVRGAIVFQSRRAIDLAVLDARKSCDESVKVFVTTPSGKSVTIYAPRMIVVNCFLTNPRPPNPRFYAIMRTIGWISFGVHITALGMSRLCNQMLTVFLLTISSVLSVRQVGDRHNLIGSLLFFDIGLGDPSEGRRLAYARLDLSEKEESSMVRWNLFPHQSNEVWWKKYRSTIESFQNGEKSRTTTATLSLPLSQQD